MSPAATPAGDIVALIEDVFARRGAESYLGEVLSMAEHMLQAAALAEAEGAPEALVAAALLHDVGHFTGEFGEDYIERGVDNLHERAGARVLARHFGPQVVAPVALHVAAKRYLCAVDADYAACLSQASVRTLALQGGPMAPAERVRFEVEPYFPEALRVRRWDDAAKVAGRATAPLGHYLPLLRRLRRGETGTMENDR